MTSTPAISAYVPCHNNRTTIRRAVESLLRQTITPAEVLVVDDGSSDASMEALQGLHVRVISHESNQGRGAARATAMGEATHDLVLCCDATSELDPAFVEKALRWFEDERVAAVFGRCTQGAAMGVADRWRGRHLFKVGVPGDARHASLLATGGALVRQSAVHRAGGYDRRLRHSEDADLGGRLLQHGFDVVQDPGLEVVAIASNTIRQVMERYWRWYAGPGEQVNWRGYLRTITYSITAMAAADLRAGDPMSAILSIATPHYQFWRSRLGARKSLE